MSELEEKIAAFMWQIATGTDTDNMTDDNKAEFREAAKHVLSLIQIEVDCPECIKYICRVCHNENKCCGDDIDCPCCNNIGFLYGKWDKNTFYVCDTCKGTGKVRVPIADGVPGIAREVEG